MNKAAVLHRVDSEYSYLLNEKTAVVRLRCGKDDLKNVSVFYGNRCYEKPIVPCTEVQMKKVASGSLHDYYEATLVPGFRRMFYYFKLDDGNEILFYYEGEFHKKPSDNRTYFYQLPYFRREEVYDVPEWARKAVMYQIFPDSFATGKKFHDQKAKTGNWNSIELTTKIGGTLKGIIDNVDYLVDLGIGAVYLNPIFVAWSYHKYNTIDYKHIDPCFGTDEEFADLVKLLHKHGIKVILDGVFNHSGSYFFAYQDILKNQEKSEYVDWYYDMKLPLLPDYKSDYACFAYVKDMPKLNTGNPKVAEYFAGVGKYWIEKYDIDGWRLDVANEVDKNFWRIYKKAIKSVKKDAFMVAEVWEDAQNWQVYDEFDSAMNYRFTNLCKDFFAFKEVGAKEFGERYYESLMRYPEPVAYAQMNLLDSHDVSRFISLCDDKPEILKLAATVQLTLPGMPSVFAGDERAMTGITEDDYRRTFVWDDEGKNCEYVACKPSEMTAHYKNLISLRKEHEALTLGKIEFLDSGNDKVLAYKRFTDNDCVTVIVNNSCEEYNWIDGKTKLNPWESKVLLG